MDKSACEKACNQYDLVLMPVTLGNVKVILELSNYQQDRLVITAGVEKVYSDGRKPKYLSKPGGKEIQLGQDIQCKITEERKRDQAGEYCLNIYYHGFCARDCKMGSEDHCACVRGKAINLSTSLMPTAAVIVEHSTCVHTLLHAR